jgi:hypothetical protein
MAHQSVHRIPTPEESASWREVAERASSPEAQAEAASRFRKLQAAEEQEGFAGDLRREISALLKREGQPPHWLASKVGIEVGLLSDFRTADATLTSDAVTRLVEVLGLHLVADAR